MGNAATAQYSKGTQVLHNIADVSIADDGGTSTPIRAITPTRKPIGWRHSQDPTHTISFTVAVLDDGVEVDWMNLKETKEEFSFGEVSDLWNRNFDYCIVQTVESTTDTDTSTVTWAVTVMALESTYATT
jgi:hypothetical protein